jgi:hypothetical protein
MTSLAPELQPICWADIEGAIYDWVNGKVGWEAIWEDQNLPQPPYPYLSLKRSGVRRVGGKPEVRTSTDLGQPLGEEIELLTTSPAEFTLTVQGFMDEDSGANDPDVNAVQTLTKLQASLGQLSVQSQLRAVGLSVVEELPVMDISEVVNGEFLNRAAFDVRLRTASVMTERTGFIEQVEVESTELGIGPEVFDAS